MEVSVVIFATGAKWHLCLSSLKKITVWFITLCVGCGDQQYVLKRPTRGTLAVYSRSFEMPKFRTGQFSCSFVPSCVRLWNWLHESIFAGEGLGAFKTSVNRFLLQD